MNPSNDIIAAIATPIGVGGIAVVRVSGNGAIDLVAKKFNGRHPLSVVPTHSAHFGHFIDMNDDIVDEVIVTVFKSPRTYTTEDIVEISSHGGSYIPRKIFEVLLACGARSAEPGEFTKRAFLNGRIDLSQAEAVADLIQSNSAISHRNSLDQLQGQLSSEIVNIRNIIINLCSLLELELDFIEAGEQFSERGDALNKIDYSLEIIDKMISSYVYGKMLRDGIRIALVGKPNVGKSSIFNLLLNNNRAIVSEIPGTTRDVIEESLNLNGLTFVLADTAGIRTSTDLIESDGISRTEKKIEESDIIILVLDASQGFMLEDEQIMRKLTDSRNKKLLIVLINKIDLIKEEIYFNGYEKLITLKISAKTGEGISNLRDTLVQILANSSTSLIQDVSVITNKRHESALREARKYIQDARNDFSRNMSNEFVADNLRIGAKFLNEIIGEVTSEDILNNIFEKFCIGK